MSNLEYLKMMMNVIEEEIKAMRLKFLSKVHTEKREALENDLAAFRQDFLLEIKEKYLTQHGEIENLYAEAREAFLQMYAVIDNPELSSEEKAAFQWAQLERADMLEKEAAKRMLELSQSLKESVVGYVSRLSEIFFRYM